MKTAQEEAELAQQAARKARVRALAQAIYTAERPAMLGPEDQHLMATESINAAEVFEFEWEAGSYT